MPCAPTMSQSVPVTLRIVAEIPAGAGFGGRLGPGEAARIFTGAPLPDGADAIVIQEDTERSGDRVEIREGAPSGRYVRRAGLDFAEGDVLLRAPAPPDAARYRPRRGDEPALAVRASPAAGRDPVDRRRDRDAGRPDRPAPDRQLERAGAVGLCDAHRAACRCWSATRRTIRTRCATSRRRRRASICSSRPAASRSASTIWCAACCRRTGSRSISGRSRCGRASR